MAIIDTLKQDMKSAMREKQKERLATIRLILAAFKQVEIDESISVDDERGISILDKMVKQRRDSIKQYEDAQRPELAAKEQEEILVIQDYLPKPLTDEEIDDLIDAAIKAVGASSAQDMGKVMGHLKPLMQGRADMGSVSGKVKQLLS
ncbi:MAG: GatB/YqeY domain-containing protein [Pseudomonadota bacterium]